MKRKIILTVLLIVGYNILLKSQGFQPTYIPWSNPQTGNIIGSDTTGFYFISQGFAPNALPVGADNWEMMDMNGDKMPDLVVTSSKNTASSVEPFGSGSNRYWKVFLNTGTGFSLTPVQWSLPVGIGSNDPSTNCSGYCFTRNEDAHLETTGAENFFTKDMNGDLKPDLVVSSSLTPTGVRTFTNTTSFRYWKVYLNTGAGFSSTFTQWSHPASSGIINYASSTIVNGYIFENYADSKYNVYGSENYYTTDMNGDLKPDMLITSWKKQDGSINGFWSGTTFNWRVYFNTGTGFSSSPTVWTMPTGGIVSTNYNEMGFPYMNYYVGNYFAETFSTLDINSDNKPDLIVTTDSAKKVFGPPGTKHWRVFLNTGNGFSLTPMQWSLPYGNGVWNKGYFVTSFAGNLVDTIGSERWQLADLDGDGNQDLNITSERIYQDTARPFGSPAARYWKMYKGTGSGFSNTYTQWSIPAGGAIGYTGYDFFCFDHSLLGTIAGQEYFVVRDMNADTKPDLVVTSYGNASLNYQTFGNSSQRYWKVYLNNSTVGEKENSVSDSKVNAYPNPFSSDLTVSIEKNVEADVLIYNSIGQLVSEYHDVRQNITINPASLAPGIYFMKVIQSTGEIKAVKLIKE